MHLHNSPYSDSALLDISLFNPNVLTTRGRPPIVLRQFQLSVSVNGVPRAIGLDSLRRFEDGKLHIGRGVHWRARTVICRPEWLSKRGFRILQRQASAQSDEALTDLINEGRVDVAIHGILVKIPQYMNSDQLPFGLRIQGADRSTDDRRSHQVIPCERWYSIESLDLQTYSKSQRFFDKYTIQHFIFKICTLHSKTPIADRTVQWLVERYQDMWDDSNQLRHLPGPRPKKCDIMHHLALYWEELEYWGKHRGPIRASVWTEFGKSVSSAQRAAARAGTSWGTVDDQSNSSDERMDLDGELLPGSETRISSYQDGPPDSAFSSNRRESAYHGPGSVIPPQMIKAIRLSNSLVWQCPCPNASHESIPCTFEIDLIDPSENVLTMLTPQESHYLHPMDGTLPAWEKHSPELHNILHNAIYRHYTEHHLKLLGVEYIEGHLSWT